MGRLQGGKQSPFLVLFGSSLSSGAKFIGSIPSLLAYLCLRAAAGIAELKRKEVKIDSCFYYIKTQNNPARKCSAL